MKKTQDSKDMKYAVKWTQLNERSIRRYIKRFDIKLKRGAYNSYIFDDKDIRKFVIIRTMLKENRTDDEILAEIKKVDEGLEGSVQVQTDLVSNELTTTNKDLVAFESLVSNLKNTLGNGIASLSESIGNIEKNIDLTLKESSNKFESLSNLLDMQKEELNEQKNETIKQSELIKKQSKLIEEQEKFLKMQIHQNMMLMKKIDDIENKMEDSGVLSKVWSKIRNYFIGEKKKYQFKN